jgi:hypothetical protein
MSVPTGWTPLVASNITDATGAKLNAGIVTVEPTDGNDFPIDAVAGGAGGLLSRICGQWTVTNGVLQAGAMVPDTTLTNPANICLRFTVHNAQGLVCNVLRLMQPSGSANFSLDTAVSPATAAQALQIIGPQGPIGGVTGASSIVLVDTATGANWRFQITNGEWEIVSA